MRSWLSLVLLCLAVAGLGAWVYHKPDAPSAQAYALSMLAAKDVKRIRVERKAAAQAAAPGKAAATDTTHAPVAAIEVERREDGWRMTAPYSARAEPFQVERLLSVLDAKSVARFPATDLARYGLHDPAVKVILDGESFAYGAVNAATREQYVLTRDGVYAIPLAQRNAVPRDADALIAHALFAPGESPVAFELPGFTATLQDGTWIVAPDDGASADERNAWVGAWRQANAVRAARHDGRAAASTIKLKLADGRTLAIGILQHEPELVLVRTDEGIQYYFFADTGKRLLAPPRAKNDAVTK